MAPGVKSTGSLRQTRQIYRLRQSEIFGSFVEVSACGRRWTYLPIAIMAAVQVLLEDAILRPDALKAKSGKIFVNFCGPTSPRATGSEFDELLGDG